MADTPVTEQTLLYDPLFETPPDTVIRDTPGRGFWGKAVVKKTGFILALLLFVGCTIALSFASLSKDTYKYERNETGLTLTEYNAGKTDTVLEVSCEIGKDGVPLPENRVTAVRQYAVCCNEITQLILLGKDVAEVPNTAFYSCSALAAVLVEPGNPCLAAVDGVLYRQENGRLTEIVLYPAKNYLYRALLALGEAPPADAAGAADAARRLAALEEKSGMWMEAQREGYPAAGSYSLTDAERDALSGALRYEIPAGMTRIGEMAFAECKTLFAVSFPEGVTAFGSMAFFKCGELRSIDLPRSTETIGSDAFSYCAKAPEIFIPAGVKEIGHHAFYGCKAAAEVRLACAEADAPALGQDWLPKQRRLFEHDVPVVYNAERRAP